MMQELQELDVLCIHEHWLFQYELSYLENFHQDFNCHAKDVDEDNPIPPTGIFYKKEIEKARKLKEGDHRIVCLEVLSQSPLIIISVYMPAKGSRARDEEYDVTLTGLDEIISRYKATHQLIIAGDFNASIKIGNPDSRDKKLRSFVENHQLHVSDGHPDIPTYIRPDGTECSHLDYIFVTDNACTKNTDVKLMVTNTSDHRPVHTDFLVDHMTLAEVKRHTPSQKKAKGWDRIDVDEYLSMTAKELEKAHIFKEINSEWEATTTLRKITGILVRCKDILTPMKQSQNRAIPCKQIVWTPEIKAALKKKKAAFGRWKDAGRPEDVSHPLFIANKNVKKDFKKAQRAQSNVKYQKDIDEISEAKRINSKLFHKLVKLRSQTKVTPKVTKLNVEGQKYTGTNIAQGWFQHFSKLAKPKYSDDVNTLQQSRDIHHITDICKTQQKLKPVSQEEVTDAIRSLNRRKAVDIQGLAAEHLRFSSPEVIAIITEVINFFRQRSHLPSQHKLGKLFPV